MGLPVLAIKSLTGNGSGEDERVDAILKLIPGTATETNKLTDKEFVNSSIATETAHYISDNGEPFTSVSDLPTTGVTNNDYAFVTGTDTAGNTYYDRYKATVSGSSATWAKEYRLNNSSFTAEQWAAIQSGITAALVAKLQGIKGVYQVNYSTATSKYDEIQAAFNTGYLVYMIYNNAIYLCYSATATRISFFPITAPDVTISSDKFMHYFYLKVLIKGSIGDPVWEESMMGVQQITAVLTSTVTDASTKLPTSKAVYDALALKANASDVKTATAYSCDMADGTTKTLTMNAVLA